MNKAMILMTSIFMIFSATTYGVDLINDKKGVAINGYDVVAYFQNFEKGIEKGLKGSSDFSSVYNSVTYYFSSQENKNAFDKNPEDYIPAYGGWCAWAVADYGKIGVNVNADTFLIAKNQNGKDTLYLFYNSWGTNTLKSWLKGNHKELVKKADKVWQKAQSK